jgi:hypothetical protein
MDALMDVSYGSGCDARAERASSPLVLLEAHSGGAAQERGFCGSVHLLEGGEHAHA